MQTEASMAVLFGEGPVRGRVEVTYGRLAGLLADSPAGRVEGADFVFDASAAGCRLRVDLAEAALERGSGATIVTVLAEGRSFSCFARDVRSANPIFIPEYGVAVTGVEDGRTYAQVAEAIRARHLKSDFQRFEEEPEESYAGAASRNRVQYCPTWLGIGRDMRLFQVGKTELQEMLAEVTMTWHSVRPGTPGLSSEAARQTPYKVNIAVGPGASCRPEISRRLEDRCLPMLRAVQKEQDVEYGMTAFATLEKGPLSAERVEGTEWQTSYAHMGGNMLPEDERAAIQARVQAGELARDEEVVCCLRFEIINRGDVPRYAWFKAPLIHRLLGEEGVHGFDGARGYSTIRQRDVYAVSRIDGRPLPNEEIAVLLQPGETVVIDTLLPHQPLSLERAGNLDALDVDRHLEACRRFWRAKLAAAARLEVPEATIDECIRAGLLHLDVATIGRTPEGPLLATIGFYAPIGSESSPIIQYYDSVGQHDLAERCIDFFLARQRDDGFIQNFGGYQLETGPVLWTMGEHFRYTRNTDWVRRVKPGLLKACDYLMKWRERNKREDSRAAGCYGMLDGKVADPQDFYHSFMLNGLSYLGLKRAVEMLEAIGDPEAAAMKPEVEAFRDDIRRGFEFALAQAPVIPTGDGSWAPFMPPWVERQGACSLYADGQLCFTHGAFLSRDVIIGPLYLVLGEVLEPGEPGTTFLLKANQQPSSKDNASLTQPYYTRHDIAHLRRGEVKPYLKTYYHQLTALHDRETRTFWEHYYHASQHKTHEEGWFLMQTRWMLWLEEGDSLSLFKAIPRAWLRSGKRLRAEGVASYFGPLTFEAVSALDGGEIRVRLSSLDAARRPRSVRIRLPHPEGRRATGSEGGVYDPATETVLVDPFTGVADVRLTFT